MRASRFFVSTLKEAPGDAEIASHRLMVRAGMIRRLAGGIYNYLPMGLRTIRKVERIVREEMDAAGALELLMPVIQPAELWMESGRWEQYGPELLRVKDRHGRDFIVQPTSEEVITDIARAELRSWRQLPKNFYHIQTKFRDERRPRFGVMRGREFTMKDAYSFDRDEAGALASYKAMYDAYTRIFTRMGLTFRAVAADTGAIGGSASHEFQVIADTGEDAIAYCPQSDYAANVELAEAVAPPEPRAEPAEALRKVPTPGASKCEDVAALLGVPLARTVKSIVLAVDAPRQDEQSPDAGKTGAAGARAASKAGSSPTDGSAADSVAGSGSASESTPDSAKAPGSTRSAAQIWLLLLRGDHELNEIKAAKVPGLAGFRFATENEIVEHFGCRPGYLGPIATARPVKVVADRTVAAMSDFVCGANEADHHLAGVNWRRDAPEPAVADLRNVVEGDASPDGRGRLALCRGIEVGHVFYLGTKYSEAMGATFLDDTGKPRLLQMGCYGIGITRLLGAAIEQNHDARGIAWPAPIAPFEAVVCPVGYDRSEAVRAAADALHAELAAAGVDVILDDRGERPGVMFADWELIGVPVRLTVGERGLKEGVVEVQARRDAAATAVPLAAAAQAARERLAGAAVPARAAAASA